MPQGAASADTRSAHQLGTWGATTKSPQGSFDKMVGANGNRGGPELLRSGPLALFFPLDAGRDLRLQSHEGSLSPAPDNPVGRVLGTVVCLRPQLLRMTGRARRNKRSREHQEPYIGKNRSSLCREDTEPPWFRKPGSVSYLRRAPAPRPPRGRLPPGRSPRGDRWGPFPGGPVTPRGAKEGLSTGWLERRRASAALLGKISDTPLLYQGVLIAITLRR